MDVKDTKPILFDNKKEIDERMKKFDELIKYVKSYLQVVHENLIAEVAGGIRQYIYLFFTKGCIQPLRSHNPQYLDILIIFQNIEKLVETLRECLDDVEKLLIDCKKYIKVTEDKDKNEIVSSQLTKYVDRVDGYHENVDELAREVYDVREENDMDTLLADERDDIGSEDNDWD